MSVTIRRATAPDVPEILRMIRALALYEGEPQAVQATEETLATALFGPEATVFAFLAEHDGQAVGLALCFFNFSTWTSGKGLYLEDLYVDERVRGLGVGRALFRTLAREARDQGCQRIDWAVLDWNSQAMGFYRRLGGRQMQGWQPWRLSGDALAALAED